MIGTRRKNGVATDQGEARLSQPRKPVTANATLQTFPRASRSDRGLGTASFAGCHATHPRNLSTVGESSTTSTLSRWMVSGAVTAAELELLGVKRLLAPLFLRLKRLEATRL